MDQTSDNQIEKILTQSGWVTALASSLVLDGDSVDDVIQETWLAARGRSPDRPERLAGWLAGVVRNVARQSRRTRMRRQDRERLAAVPTEEVGDSPADRLERAELHRKVVDAVLRLEASQRDVLLLRYFDGLSAEEIATRRQEPPSTVRNRIRRALLRLRELLGDDLGVESRSLGFVLLPLAAPTKSAVSMAMGGAVAMGVKMSLKLKVAMALLIAAITVVLFPFGEPGDAPTAGVIRDDPAPVEIPAQERSGGPSDSVPVRSLASGAVDAPSREPIVLLALGKISGRVIDRQGSGVPGATVIGFDGAPVEYGTFRLRMPSSPRFEIVTGADGEFEYPVETARPFRVIAEHERYAPSISQVCFAHDQVEIILDPGARFTGLVRNEESGQPIAGAEVTLHFGDREQNAPRTPGQGERSGLTDAHGQVTITGLPGGHIGVSIEKEGFADGAGRLASDGVNPLTGEYGLQQGASIHGVVVATENGRPIGSARVGCKSLGFTHTDEWGRFRLEDVTPFYASENSSRSTGIIATAVDRSPTVLYIAHPGPQQRVDVEIRMPQGGPLKGRVLAANGDAVAQATVGLACQVHHGFTADHLEDETVTDDEGRFSFNALRTDVGYHLGVSAESYGAMTRWIGVVATATDLGDLVLKASASISGRVEGSGESVERDRIRVYREFEPPSAQDGGLTPAPALLGTTIADSSGRYRFGGLSAGRYRVQLHAFDARDGDFDDRPRIVRKVALEAGDDDSEVDLIRRPDGEVSGHVVSEKGRVLGRMLVELLDLSQVNTPIVTSTFSDKDGSFLLAFDAVGAFRVRAHDRSRNYDDAFVDVAAGGGAPVELRMKERATGEIIRGRVLDRNGDVVSKVFVSFEEAVSGNKLTRLAIPDDEGWFEMKNLDRMAYHVRTVDMRNRYGEVERLSVLPSSSAVIDLRVSPIP